MSSQAASSHFKKFGIIMIIITILTILSFVSAFINYIFNFWWIRNIGTSLSIIAIIFRIAILLILLILMGEIRKAANKYNDPVLQRFRYKIIIFIILRFLGYLIIIYYFSPTILFSVEEPSFSLYILFWMSFTVAIILIITSAIFEIQAWNSFKSFLSKNIQSFPANTVKNSKLGSTLCMIASIFDSTLVLWFIGDILRIIGYFILTNLKNLAEGDVKEPPQHPTPQPIQPLPIPIPISIGNKKFCPNCGAPLKGFEKFCTVCGSKI